MTTRLRAPNGRFRRVTLADVLDRVIVGGPIAPERWGRDHWSTLLYVDTRIVDHHGLLSALRQDSHLGPKGRDPHMRMDHKYPTRLMNPEMELRGHTDYDCLADAIAAGYLAIRPRPADVNVRWGSQWPYYSLTEAHMDELAEGDALMEAGNAIQFYWTDTGYELISSLRRWRSEGQPVDQFAVAR